MLAFGAYLPVDGEGRGPGAPEPPSKESPPPWTSLPGTTLWAFAWRP
jgi:hypothetical protein